MSIPSTQELERAIVDILSSARDKGQLSQLTVRIVRQELATHFDLEEDVLNGETHKSFIKATVHATVNRLQNASDEGAAPPPRKAAKMEKETSGSVAKTPSRKAKAKGKVHASDEELPEAAHASEGEGSPSKKPSARPKPAKPAKSEKPSKKPESEIRYKSKAIIESSDDEAVPESRIQRSTRSPKKEKMPAKPLPPKQKQVPSSKQHANKDDSDVEMYPVDGPGPPSSGSKPKHATESPKTSVSKSKELTGNPMESELSSVTDEPPKKRQKKQEKKPAKPPKDEKTKRGKKEALSKDEETINKLKGIVVACGIRKVWKKEFEGLDKPSQQIKRLHSILGDIGMTPRYSLEKAKAIRERRELAQELEDVQEFDKAIKRRGKPRSSSETEEPADQGDSDADMPARKRQSARASIMAFLQDQSEEE